MTFTTCICIRHVRVTFTLDTHLLVRIQVEVVSGRGEGELPYTGDGKLINSVGNGLELDGLTVDKAKSTTLAFLEDKKLGTKKINYKLRDWLFRCVHAANVLTCWVARTHTKNRCRRSQHLHSFRRRIRERHRVFKLREWLLMHVPVFHALTNSSFRSTDVLRVCACIPRQH